VTARAVSAAVFAVYNPADEPVPYTFGSVEFTLRPNKVNELKPPPGRDDITSEGLLHHVLVTLSVRGVREVKDQGNSKAVKKVVEEAEEAHALWPRTTLGAVLERHKKAQADDVKRGLKPRPDPPEVVAARKMAKEWGIL